MFAYWVDIMSPCNGTAVLFNIFTVATIYGIRQCCYPECVERRHGLSHVAPTCQWAAFRELILTTVSCWSTMFMWRLLESTKYLLLSLDALSDLPVTPLHPCVDIHGVYDLLRWAYRVMFDPAVYFAPRNPSQTLPMVNHGIRGYEARLSNLPQLCRHHDLCPSRFWNVGTLGQTLGWAATDISHIAGIASSLPSTPAHGDTMMHQDCTGQVCLRGYDNSAAVRQAHKCEILSCDEVLLFPLGHLNEAYAMRDGTPAGSGAWRQTAWSVNKIGELCASDEPYIAISHFWSDGTGVGVRKPGEVNKCLWDFFAEHAKALGCAGVWWDAICIPSGREERRKAINTMLDNYERARYTVIHDQRLLESGWYPGGGPAVSLVLSSWFTRGWTAAELLSSSHHGVKVLFMDPTNGLVVLKDLDHDVLALDPMTADDSDLAETRMAIQPGSGIYTAPDVTPRFEALYAERRTVMLSSVADIPSLGHFMASDIVQRLRRSHLESFAPSFRGGRVATVEDLLDIMGTRITSWVRDRSIIAGLLCLDASKFDSYLSSVKITQGILAELGAVSVRSLMHAECTMKAEEPWSWSPPSVYDFGKFRQPRSRGGEIAVVHADGSMTVCLMAFEIHETDNLVCTSSHPALNTKVSIAQNTSESCVLLRNVDETEGLPMILASIMRRPDSRKEGDDAIFCRWIACVRPGSGCSYTDDDGVFVTLVFGAAENWAENTPVELDTRSVLQAARQPR